MNGTEKTRVNKPRQNPKNSSGGGYTETVRSISSESYLRL